MSTAISICHGKFGRAALYQLDRPLTRHAHREGHLKFHVQGERAYSNVCTERCSMTPCQAVAVNPWQMHDFVPGNLEKRSLFLVLYIKPMWFLEFNRSPSIPLRFGSPRIEMDQPLSRLVTKVVTLLLSAEHSDLLDGYLYELTEQSFEQSYRWIPEPEGFRMHQQAITGDLVYDSRLRRAISLMSEHIDSDVGLDGVAREAGLSRPHFFKLFRDETGLTPNLFMNTLRMERAIEWLTETRHSVSEIGIDLGFSSQSSFTRFFSSNAGMAPTSYRRVAHLRHS